MHRFLSASMLALCSLAVAAAAHAEQPPIAEQLVERQHPSAGGWQLADLADTMKSLRDRSYANGKRLFERAHCAACHRQDGIGSQFGPDLTRLDLQFQPLDILRDILDPSRRIADAKYDLWVFATDSGRIVAGMIQQETDQFVKVLEKPSDVAEPITLMKTELESRMMSLTSIMPQGLVDQLTREEIADLVAYVAARGDPNDPLVRTPPSKTEQILVPTRAHFAESARPCAGFSESGTIRRYRTSRRARYR